MTARWLEVGDGVLVRRYTELDLSIGLVLGDGECLVVDSRGDVAQGAELAAAVREVTRSPWTVVLTHSHWDHCFGTASLLPSDVWAHEECRADLAAHGRAQRESVVEWYTTQGRTADAERVADVEPVLPDRLVRRRAELVIGGRPVTLAYFGRGHTAGDLVAHVPDAGVVYAGDLVEQGAPPAFEDAYPLDWPLALDGILDLAPAVVVPGHGEPVHAEFVAGQRADIAGLARAAADLLGGRCDRRDALRRSPYPTQVLDTAVRRILATRPDVAK
jgi:glyoxylase-like metal-dependent hydrolase (beta-lactamase superfamily II)